MAHLRLQKLRERAIKSYFSSFFSIFWTLRKGKWRGAKMGVGFPPPHSTKNFPGLLYMIFGMVSMIVYFMKAHEGSYQCQAMWIFYSSDVLMELMAGKNRFAENSMDLKFQALLALLVCGSADFWLSFQKNKSVSTTYFCWYRFQVEWFWSILNDQLIWVKIWGLFPPEVKFWTPLYPKFWKLVQNLRQKIQNQLQKYVFLPPIFVVFFSFFLPFLLPLVIFPFSPPFSLPSCFSRELRGLVPQIPIC